ncbi:EAL domain-containing response regulator [Hydrocarboniphaga sp.]|uniref:EAL domain-containing response regulator n=1 Tax=Hydrocarboniphaga sp. TaxID=2033016 RepID=UPI00261D0E1B|nr:EAL domain-containing response regulator [Hydrocarboniphaga sp.]
MRLLILDDQADVGQVIALAARSATCEARATTNADAFFQTLDAWSPTHLVIDLVMPDMDGVEVVRRLAERGCRARIIIASGVGSRILDSARRLAIEHNLDFAGVLAKPFTPRALRALLIDVPQAVPFDPLTIAVTASELQLALTRHELQVYYQPKVHCSGGQLAGFEALLRWHHPIAGTILPDRFIPVAESSGLIRPITDLVVEQSFAWLARSFADADWSISVNLSPLVLNDLGLADRLLARSRQHAIDPKRLIFEATETSAMDQSINSLDVLTRLRLNGFQVSIDDFGTGYSSMAQLVRMPFSEMKIDKSFVMSALQSSESRAIIEATVALGHSLGLCVTAEGVEDAATLEYLRMIGCDLAQGYYLARAIPGNEVGAWITGYRSRLAAAVGSPVLPGIGARLSAV